MAALKWIVVVICSLGAAGSLGLGFMEGGVPASTTAPPALAPLAMRALPALPSMAAGAAAPAPVPAAAPKPADDAKPAADEPPKPADDAKPAADAKAPAADAPKPADPEPVAAKPPAPAPVAKPPAPKPAPAAAPAAEGTMNLRASDTADVYVDGKKVGGSPVVGFKSKAGTHRVRFDCYDAAGNAIAGPVKTVTVKADEEQDVDFTCPEAE